MLSTAAELWEAWVRSRTLRPQDYDRDVADRVQEELTRQGYDASGPLAAAMQRAKWTPRDLLHALAPLLASFAGMHRDLLRLLERAGATSGQGENLRLVYQFAENDAFDESLAAFREYTRRAEVFAIHVQPWVVSGELAWRNPLR